MCNLCTICGSFIWEPPSPFTIQLDYCCCHFKKKLSCRPTNDIKYCNECMILHGCGILYNIRDNYESLYDDIEVCKYCKVYHQIRFLSHSIMKDNNEAYRLKRTELIDEFVQLQIDSKISKISGNIYTKECDLCRSWDGVDRRCRCGNRRIDWGFDEPEDSECANISLYPEAY